MRQRGHFVFAVTEESLEGNIFCSEFMSPLWGFVFVARSLEAYASSYTISPRWGWGGGQCPPYQTAEVERHLVECGFDFHRASRRSGGCVIVVCGGFSGEQQFGHVIAGEFGAQGADVAADVAVAKSPG